MTNPEEKDRHGHAWPEALAITVVLALFALLATGWVDAMLPWTN